MENNKEYRKFLLNAKMSVFKYLLTVAFLAFVNWLTTPYYWWVLWVIGGWGIGLSLNLISQYYNYKLESEE
ncbi:hypothetical protein D0T50_10610 [Bacteroides sp. 214]|uniref:2TM domain-containing protein n=1 Tax=Bacteroides sp. 214 TaxID=2302935 RepID=UPI0013D4BAD8|nr:2TM domain-containing protein [Bacteroides sp. 214]NDW13340.1 hypothetical protein [Bacteroides sp. 214]